MKRALSIFLTFLLLLGLLPTWVMTTHAEEVCDHSWSDWAITTEASFEESGQRSRSCTLCGDVQTEEIVYEAQPCEHSWGTWTVTKEASPEESGQRSRSCTLCDEMQTEEIAYAAAPVDEHLNHSNGIKQDGQEATENSGWKDYYLCSGCEKLFEEAACITEIPDLEAWKQEGGRGYLEAIPNSLAPEANGLAIDETNFQDPDFRNYLSKSYDSDKDGYLSDAEIAAVNNIGLSKYPAITSLEGIAHFTSLTILDCSNLSLTSLDVRSNTALQTLDCTGNQLTELLIPTTYFGFLDCSDNDLTSLDLKDAVHITQLNCSYNNLTDLSALSDKKNLFSLNCSNNQLTSLDLANYRKVGFLDCSKNRLTVLKTADSGRLNWLNCSDNMLTSLEVWLNPVHLYCENNIYTIAVDPDTRTFDLTTLPGSLVPNRIISLQGATRNNNIITVNPSVTQVTYKYDVDGTNGSKTAVFTLNVTSGHTHTWSTDYPGKDTTHHWNTCDHCDEIRDKAPHDYDNDTDATCSTCGYVRTIAANKYAVTVNGSYAKTTGTGRYEAGDTVTIYAGNRSNYRFNGWTSSDITIANANQKTTSFLMPAGNVTVTAHWTYNGSSSSGVHDHRNPQTGVAVDFFILPKWD